MADQIIIELIGDPSGLKPAEDALKQLSKISEENLTAFNKANEAFTKFTASASTAAKSAKDFSDNSKETGKALESIGTSANNSITAISGLNGAIAAGAVKAVTADYKDWSKEVAALTEKKQQLKTKIEDNVKLLNKFKASGDTASDAFKAIMHTVSSLRGDLGQNTKDFKKLETAMAQSGKAATDAGTAAEKSGGKFKLLATGIGAGAKSTADLLGHTRTLTSAMGEVGEAIAHASGNEETANEIKKQTAAAIQAISVAQAVATTATEATTVATTLFGEEAAAAWAEATLGISVLIGLVVALATNIKAVTGWLKNLFLGEDVFEISNKTFRLHLS
jgi:chromosome segregation ATPase